MVTISIYGCGQLGNGVDRILRSNPRYNVTGPLERSDRSAALAGGADLVVIATTTRLRDVASDIETAVAAGSNVLVSAEEAAFPFGVDPELAGRLDEMARECGVTIAGAGVNPGLIFDSLVLTLLGAAPRGCTVQVRRNVDLSGFGTTVLRRIGVGSAEVAFYGAVERGEILGHAGFPQSMSVVAHALGLRIERIDKVLRPVIGSNPVDLPGRFEVKSGECVGVDQTYTAFVEGTPWYVAHFFGHVALASTGRTPSDDIDLSNGENQVQSIKLRPGIDAQVGSVNMVANSVERVLAARSGWVTVAEMRPAYPAPLGPPAHDA